jgi:hypothetical protein
LDFIPFCFIWILNYLKTWRGRYSRNTVTYMANPGVGDEMRMSVSILEIVQ